MEANLPASSVPATAPSPSAPQHPSASEPAVPSTSAVEGAQGPPPTAWDVVACSALHDPAPAPSAISHHQSELAAMLAAQQRPQLGQPPPGQHHQLQQGMQWPSELVGPSTVMGGPSPTDWQRSVSSWSQLPPGAPFVQQGVSFFPPGMGGSAAAMGVGKQPAGVSKRMAKKPRLVWTYELHQRFINAVTHLGVKNAVPKTILQLMNVEGMTRENVASHLQKYRLYLKKMAGLPPNAQLPPDVAQHMQGVAQSFHQQQMALHQSAQPFLHPGGQPLMAGGQQQQMLQQQQQPLHLVQIPHGQGAGSPGQGQALLLQHQAAHQWQGVPMAIAGVPYGGAAQLGTSPPGGEHMQHLAGMYSLQQAQAEQQQYQHYPMAYLAGFSQGGEPSGAAAAVMQPGQAQALHSVSAGIPGGFQAVMASMPLQQQQLHQQLGMGHGASAATLTPGSAAP